MTTKTILLIGALLNASFLHAQTADDFIAAGRDALVAHQPVAASSNFNAAVQLSPSNAPANLLAAATRLILLPQSPAVNTFLDTIGVSAAGRDIYDWTADFNHDANDDVILPPNLNSTLVITVYSNTILPAVRACQTNLSRITDTNFILNLTAGETASQDATLDYGDIQLLRALLYAADAFGRNLNAHNLSFVINHIRDLGNNNQLTLERILKDYPNLLGLKSQAEVAASRAPFTNAIVRYLEASDFIHTGRSNGAVRLFNLAEDQVDNEATFRDIAARLVPSLDQPVDFDLGGDHLVYAGAYFAGNASIRSKIPKFSGNRYVYNSLPDYSFGGILIDPPSTEIEAFLRNTLGRPQPGIYIGTFFSYDFMSDYYEDGEFAIFVRTNGHATVFGSNTNLESALFAEFALEPNAHWQFETNGIQSDGRFERDGSVSGSLNDANYYWFNNFQGSRVSDSGVFQGQAGFYSGSYSGSQQSGQLRAVLSAGGELFFCAFNSGDPGGVGHGQLDTSTGHFVAISGDTTVQGALNSGMLKISGTFSNVDDHGTFTITRSVGLPLETPPIIVSPMADQVGQVGGDINLTVNASGSPPRSYQWFSNDVPILHATSATLALHNLSYSDAATYSVIVTNFAGATNDDTVLTVVAENTRPTISITSPTAGQRISNNVAQVSGAANDNASVTNVSCRINDGPWSNALGTAGWTISLGLVQGTNVVESFAADSSGNLSQTSRVSFVYVAVDRLTLQITGTGTLAPNYSNAVLLVGKSYTIKATPGAGYVLSNWLNAVSGDVLTNGQTLAFVMQSNLVLQANFVSNPFTPVKGAYNGLFTSGATPAQDSSGFFTLTLKDSSLASGSLQIGSKKYPFTSKFDLTGYASNTVTRSGTNPLALTMNLDLSGDSLQGTLTDNHWLAGIQAYRAVFDAKTNPAILFSNKYTLVIAGTNGDNTLPGGDGFGTVTVSAAGKVTLAGTLADNTTISQNVPISGDGDWPLYVPLYGGKGSLYSWMRFVNTNPPAYVGGVVSWIKPPLPTAKVYPGGFDFLTFGQGEAYFPPATGHRVMEISNSIVVFLGGSLAGDFTNDTYLTLANKVTNASPNKLTFTLTPAKGTFSGTVTVPDSSQTLPFKGALLQDDEAGFGFFVNSNKTGTVLFGTPDTLFPPP